ncbi:hypothetical protein [Sandarakinorhabdus rubra]|uniref:hypothetical protein n=1 Tax=Sandarakinorhabdus rubra TaxID=2672568 RepID=UPI0013DAE6E6|nr:hypothetical protein [Sandarakinorhabdus rubra]
MKLLVGLAATVVLARGAAMTGGGTVIGRLNWAAQQALLKEGVADGSVSFRQPSGLIGREAWLSGSADAATRARVIARLRRHPGMADAHWVNR